MSEEKVKKFLERVSYRYQRAKKKEKKQILDEFCANYGYHRKYAIVLLQGKKKSPAKRRGAQAIYTDRVVDILCKIWQSAGYPCSKRLKPVISLFLPWYKKDHFVSELEEEKLSSISAPTIDRKLKPFHHRSGCHGFSTTKPGSLLKSHIPIKTDNWDVFQPGYLEADTVAHCGNSMAGDFIFSITCVDIATGWVEQRAIWNKGQVGTLEAIKSIENSIPFALKGFDCDNGSEFLNHHLWKYCSERPEGEKVQFTRSRPYKKNDNAHVEQKNWTHVRQLLGYKRLNNPKQVKLINDLYTKEWNWYANFFCSSAKLVNKERIGSKIIKKYDEPKTPFQRLLEHKSVSKRKKLKLTCLMEGLNPFELNVIISRKVEQILNMVQ